MLKISSMAAKSIDPVSSSSILLLALWTLLAAPAINPGALADAQGCFVCTVKGFLWYSVYVIVCAGVSLCMLRFFLSAEPCRRSGWDCKMGLANNPCSGCAYPRKPRNGKKSFEDPYAPSFFEQRRSARDPDLPVTMDAWKVQKRACKL